MSGSTSRRPATNRARSSRSPRPRRRDIRRRDTCMQSRRSTSADCRSEAEVRLKSDTTAVIGVILLVLATRLLAEDWPAFRGPTGQGHSSEHNLPLEWSESRHVIWKAPVPGRGWSSPIVAGGRVWLTTSVTDRGASLRLLGFDAATGRELVNVEAIHTQSARLLNEKNSLASPTPIVDGDRVYVHFGAQGTAALTTTGEVVWTARFPYESQHGNGGSPILYGDLLIVRSEERRVGKDGRFRGAQRS